VVTASRSAIQPWIAAARSSSGRAAIAASERANAAAAASESSRATTSAPACTRLPSETIASFGSKAIQRAPRAAESTRPLRGPSQATNPSGASAIGKGSARSCGVTGSSSGARTNQVSPLSTQVRTTSRNPPRQRGTKSHAPAGTHHVLS
jgi:hypothetical protein